MSREVQPSLFTESEEESLINIYNREFQKSKEEKLKELRASLDLVRFDDPKTDNDIMLNLQYEYLINGSEDAKSKLWEMAYKMATNILNGVISRSKKYISQDEKEERIGRAVIDVMKRYNKIYYRGTKIQRKDKLYPYAYSVKNYVIQFQLAIKKTFGYIPHLEYELVGMENIESPEMAYYED